MRFKLHKYNKYQHYSFYSLFYSIKQRTFPTKILTRCDISYIDYFLLSLKLHAHVS